VHGLPSSVATSVPAWQCPAPSQVSLPSQIRPLEHDAPLSKGVWVTPENGSHASAVQGLESSVEGATPATHAPVRLHVSVPLHSFPSEQNVPSAKMVCEHAPAKQASAVQGLPSSQLAAEHG
jgi:hypothetical protein